MSASQQPTYPAVAPDTSKTSEVDPSFFVRGKSFFSNGRVLAVILNETAGTTSTRPESLISVKYQDNIVYTQLRRFIVVRANREFAYACPIYTYGDRATTKPGVFASEHAVVYSLPGKPTLIKGEDNQLKRPIPVKMASGVQALTQTSRIYLGIVHPIQYNIRVKEIGQVPASHLPTLIEDWASVAESSLYNSLSSPVDSNRKKRKRDHPSRNEHGAEVIGSSSDARGSSQDDSCDEKIVFSLEPVCGSTIAPRAFFKKGRVFKAQYAELESSSEELIISLAHFTVIKSFATHCICLRINTGPIFFPSRPCEADSDWIAAVPLRQQEIEQLYKSERKAEEIMLKVENRAIRVSPELQINFKHPCTIHYNTKIINIGRLLPDSIMILEKLFAGSLGLIKG